MLNENEERTLSRRRAIVLIFLVGFVVLSLIFLIRMGQHSRIGEQANIVERLTPIMAGPVAAAVNGDTREGGEAARLAVQDNQRDPRLLLSALFGSLYSRQDFLKK